MTLKYDNKIIDPKSQDGQILSAISNALYNNEPLSGTNGVITKLIKQALESSLDGEIDQYICDNKLESGNNRKNGHKIKTIKSCHGEFALATPRDRNSSFEPEIVKKRQTVLNDEIANKILSLYSIGTSYSDIAYHIADLYGMTVSDAMINSITDKLLPQITSWRQRPLEPVYAILFLDAMFFKVREEGTVKHKAMYNIMGVDPSGKKDILGFYFADSEGASFWLGVLNDLKARGINDILIACIDGLKGFPEAINTAFPKTEVQLCIVHQIRNTMKLVSSKDQKAFIKDLKTVYQASSIEIAEAQLLEIQEKWKQYSAALRGWVDNWEALTTYFKFAPHVRKLIYTTNPIEGFHRQLRKYTKAKGAFTSENALAKQTFAAIMKIMERWNQPLQNWPLTLSELDIHFPGRLQL